jgi:hypothetical protein
MPSAEIGNVGMLIVVVGVAVVSFLVGMMVGARLVRRSRGGQRNQRDRDRGRDRDRDRDRGRGGEAQGRAERDRDRDRERGRPAPERERGPDEADGAADGPEVYVGNLSYEVNDESLGKLFAPYGKVSSARIIQNRFNGKSKGYGFVEMPDKAERAAAVAALNGSEHEGRKLVVNEARSRPRD